MTSVVKGGFGAPSSSPDAAGGTEFISILHPPKDKLDGYDNSKPCSKQTITVPPPFSEAMAVREEVFGAQDIPLEAEFDEDDARSWHWVAYASVATTGSAPKNMHAGSQARGPTDEARRSSASATRKAVATIRLIPPPHGPNKYREETHKTDKHTDVDPPSDKIEPAHPNEPYVKLGRLATLKAYRGNHLASLLITAAFDYAKANPDTIYKPPSPAAMERAQIKDPSSEQQLQWEGLVMIHAQADLKKMWEKHGFSEELKNDKGEVEIAAAPHWVEEGINHIGMWRRIEVRKGRSA